MRFRERDDFLELTVAERCKVVHGLGDTRFSLRVRVSHPSAVFTAESAAWVEFRALVSFADQLQRLEERRQGSAVLESMTPGELRLVLCTIDRAGHMAAIGQVGERFGIGSGEFRWSVVAFRLAFCPTDLPALVRDFRALAIAPPPDAGPRSRFGGE